MSLKNRGTGGSPVRVMAFALALLGATAAFGNVIRAVPGGTGDGGSWATAMALDAALGAAQAGDEMRKTAGRRSTAIDMGDPASAWALEPEPNGSRVNLGAYGNTPWATLSPYGFRLLVR